MLSDAIVTCYETCKVQIFVPCTVFQTLGYKFDSEKMSANF